MSTLPVAWVREALLVLCSLLLLCAMSLSCQREEKVFLPLNMKRMLKCNTYEDDISAVVVVDTEQELQVGVYVMMTEFEEYFSSAGLKMNPTKSELIVFQCGK